jgi:ABC-type Na+ efflux pump permease subunit
MRSGLSIIRRDWSEYKRAILVLTAGMFTPFLLAGPSADFSKGFMTGLMISAGYGFAQVCFFSERQRRTLDLLLSLPIRPRNLIISKYASLYSMTLFTVNIPGVFMGDFSALFLANAASIFVATLSMTPSVLSDKSWAPQLPLWSLLLVILPARRVVTRFWPAGVGLYTAMSSHVLVLAAAALISAPMIALLAAIAFEKKSVV